MTVNQFLFNLFERHLFAVEHVAPSLVDFHRADVLFFERPVRLTAVRQIQRQPLLQQRCRDHENDQQHKRKVDQRRDVEVTEGDERVAL